MWSVNSKPDRLLGHESPETTLQHYVHLLDWILGQSLVAEHCEPQVSAAAISSLTGLSPSQIYYQGRGENNSGNETGGFRFSQFISRNNNLPHPYASPLRQPLLVPVMTQISTHNNDFVQMYKIIPRILSTMGAGKPIDGVAKNLNLSVETFHQWRRVADWIRALKTADNIPRHLNVATAAKGISVFPAPSKTIAEKTMEQKVFFYGCKLAQADKGQLIAFLLDFLKNYRISDKGIRFDSEMSLKKAVDTLRSLGIKKNELIVVVNTPDINAFNAAKNNSVLEKDLGNAATVIQGKSNATKAEDKHFTVKIVDISDKRNNPKIGTYYSNYGFRSAIYLLAIMILTDKDIAS